MSSTKEAIIDRLKSIILTHTYLKQSKDGYYYGEIYVEYPDKFENSTIKKIFKSNNPREMFYEIINDVFLDYDSEYYSDLINTIEEYFGNEHDEDYFSEYKDFICDWVHENVYFNYPYNHYLSQDVCVNIIVDAGDGNYDYTLNQLFGFYATGDFHKEQKEHSALVWLMRQQGYTMEQIKNFITNQDMHSSKLLKSIFQEVTNTSSPMNALTFFVKMTLGELLDLHEKANHNNDNYSDYMSRKSVGKGNIVLKQGTPCGMFDAWNGAGGILEIDLEKDVVLPFKHVDSILPDGCRGGYSVDNVYGMCRSFWKDNCVKVVEDNVA